MIYRAIVIDTNHVQGSPKYGGFSRQEDRAKKSPDTPVMNLATLLPLALQLLLQFVEEPPVGTLGDELLRTALEHAGLSGLGAMPSPMRYWSTLSRHTQHFGPGGRG